MPLISGCSLFQGYVDWSYRIGEKMPTYEKWFGNKKEPERSAPSANQNQRTMPGPDNLPDSRQQQYNPGPQSMAPMQESRIPQHHQQFSEVRQEWKPVDLEDRRVQTPRVESVSTSMGRRAPSGNQDLVETYSKKGRVDLIERDKEIKIIGNEKQRNTDYPNLTSVPERPVYGGNERRHVETSVKDLEGLRDNANQERAALYPEDIKPRSLNTPAPVPVTKPQVISPPQVMSEGIVVPKTSLAPSKAIPQPKVISQPVSRQRTLPSSRYSSEDNSSTGSRRFGSF